MIPELGLLALVLALLFSLFAIFVPSVGFIKKNAPLQVSVRFYAVAQSLCVGIAYLCLTFCFFKNAFIDKHNCVQGEIKIYSGCSSEELEKIGF